MQRIYPTSLTPEQYAQQEYHRQVSAPENCPNCNRAHTLEGLAYYHRYISTATALVLWIWVRRFWCRHCRISVSCLPAFAQPYRVVNTPTVAAGFNGEATRPEVQRWRLLIGEYWSRFEAHLPALLRQVGNMRSVRCRSAPRLKASGGNCWSAAAIWPMRRVNSSISSIPACSALTAAINVGRFRLHKAGPPRSAVPVCPHRPFL